MPGVDMSLFFPFHHFCFLLLLLLRNHLPKGSVCLSVSCVKKSSGALTHLFQSPRVANISRQGRYIVTCSVLS